MADRLQHFAFLAPPLTGHIKPLAAIAHALAARGHRGTFVHLPQAAEIATQYEVPFAAVDGDAGEHRGVAGTVAEMARQTARLCDGAPALLRRIGATAVISDQLEAAGGLVARHLGLPLVTVAAALPIDREDGVPPPYVGWHYLGGPVGRWRNRGGWRISDLLMRPLRRVIADRASAWGLGRLSRLEHCFSDRLNLAQAVAGIDFPRRELPPGHHYLGPFRSPSVHDALGLKRGRLLVYCSLGTLQGGHVHLFRAVAEACAARGLDLVLTHCGRLTAADVASLPGDVRAFEFLPQQRVLLEADLVVTHGGFNTVLETLIAGLPMIVLPIAFDQPAVAARVRRAGVGLTIKPGRATGARLTDAMTRLLDDPSYRSRAGALAGEIAAAGGAERAADLILQTVTQPVRSG